MFLNRMFTSAKEKYWFIELKMTDFVWLVKRIRHFIEIFKHVIVIYTNHAANSFIARQIKFINSSVNKFNMKLIRASAYLSQFRLDIRYKSDKEHIISNAFNRLFITNRMFSDKNNVLNIENFHIVMIDSKNDFTYVYQNDLIVVSNDFKKRLQKNYRTNSTWKKILTMLKEMNVRAISDTFSLKQLFAFADKSQ